MSAEQRALLTNAMQRVAAGMEVYADAVVDHLATGQPNAAEVARLGMVAEAAFSGFTGEAARMLTARIRVPR